MILYHGTNVDFNEIEIKKTRRRRCLLTWTTRRRHLYDRRTGRRIEIQTSQQPILLWNKQSYSLTQKIEKMTKEQINKYLTNRAVDKMTEYLMQDYNISIEQALDFIYNSDTYQKLNDKETGLYVESPAYIYQLLDREYKTGVFA